AGILCDDVNERRNRIRIGFDVQSSKGNDSGDHHQNEKRHHEGAHTQREGDDSVQGSSAPHARLQLTQLRAYGSSSLRRRKKNWWQRGQRKFWRYRLVPANPTNQPAEK